MQTGASGTYVIGASTRPSVIALSAADFNLYLREDGIPDILVSRRHAGQLQTPTRERYHKHVKALIQVGSKVGSTRSDHFATELGYPAEIIPLENPYTLVRGRVLHVRTLVDGATVANQ